MSSPNSKNILSTPKDIIMTLMINIIKPIFLIFVIYCYTMYHFKAEVLFCLNIFFRIWGPSLQTTSFHKY